MGSEAGRVWRRVAVHGGVLVVTAAALASVTQRTPQEDAELPNRIPEAPPYVTAEARHFPPPFEEHWRSTAHPGRCQGCHRRVFDEWNGSMMSNAWRDPAWRAAFLLAARQTSTHGDCDTPEPPDGTPRARHNPFAVAGECRSRFDLGDGSHTVSRPGSLLDGFCARCHMPSNYVDNVPLHGVGPDSPSGREHARLDPSFHPTGAAGTGVAFATVAGQRRNTESGKLGVSCAVCHSFVATRETPYRSLARGAAGEDYVPALGRGPRRELLAPERQDVDRVPDPEAPGLGYSVGAGSFRLSPHALVAGERLGPLAAHPAPGLDRELSSVFGRPIPNQDVDASKHGAFRHVLITRSEMCAACHDVTNPLTLRNVAGRFVGGFPIERTYTEWASSRYADRPGNPHFDPAFKRDCQTCHMQQDFGRPGTAQTLYADDGRPLPPLHAPVADGGVPRPYFSHHFVGGNAYVTRLIGEAADELGSAAPYPELSAYSFSSADKRSVYANAYWTGVEAVGGWSPHQRLAWDRLRHVLELELSGPETVRAGSPAELRIRVTNTGSGHNFPTGFPEGRTAWLAVRAFDLGSGRELPIRDRHWRRESLGVGRLTAVETADPQYPACNWLLPAGSPDPYALQFKAVASLGDGCPTLDLPYAAPLNLVTDGRGLPVDAAGRVIDRDNPGGVPRFRDLDGDGDVFDDAFLADTRLRPLPHPQATLSVDRYAVVVPADAQGPVAVAAVVYYQSIEAVAAVKLLGNLADTDTDFSLEPCVLGGACDGRVPQGEPAVVEGAPPVPMEARNWVIRVDGAPADTEPPRLVPYPPPGSEDVPPDVVVKAAFSEPVRGVDARRLTLWDPRGRRVPAAVDQIGDGTWAVFPDAVRLEAGGTYTARLGPGVCDAAGNCTSRDVSWRFRVGTPAAGAGGDSRVALGFPGSAPAPAPPRLRSVAAPDPGRVVVAFSGPVMNVTPLTVSLERAPDGDGCGAGGAGKIRVRLRPVGAWDVWQIEPEAPLEPGASYCLGVSRDVYDLSGRGLAAVARSRFSVPRP